MKSAGQKQEVIFNHNALYVKDLNRSIAFYQNIIGLESAGEPFKDGLHAWFKIGDGLTLHIIQGEKRSVDQYRNTHACYSVNDLTTFVAHLVKEGIVYEDATGNLNKINIRVDGIEQVYFKDPDGYWIEINNDKRK